MRVGAGLLLGWAGTNNRKREGGTETRGRRACKSENVCNMCASLVYYNTPWRSGVSCCPFLSSSLLALAASLGSVFKGSLVLSSPREALLLSLSRLCFGTGVVGLPETALVERFSTPLSAFGGATTFPKAA